MTKRLQAWRRLPIAAVLVALLAACSTTTKPDPTPLEPLEPQVTGRQVWKHDIGKVSFPLAVAVNRGVFTVADDSGQVMALEAESGKEVWRADVNEKLSAGVGSDGRFTSVVTRESCPSGYVTRYTSGMPSGLPMK